jgi:hypothetical protein
MKTLSTTSAHKRVKKVKETKTDIDKIMIALLEFTHAVLQKRK